MELKYYTILTSPNYNNPSLLVKDWNKENYPFGFGGVNHDGTECIWAKGQEVYLKADVDEAISELKQKLEDAKAMHYAEMVDSGIRERRLRRELYKACANWAKVSVAFHSSYATKDKWRKMERRCLKKVEEYK